MSGSVSSECISIGAGLHAFAIKEEMPQTSEVELDSKYVCQDCSGHRTNKLSQFDVSPSSTWC